MAVCDSYLNDIDTAYDDADWLYDFFVVPKRTWLVANYSTSAFNLTWRTNVALAISNLSYIAEYLIHCNIDEYHPYRLPYYLRNCIEAEEYILTWKDICEAWAANDFEGKEWTVAIIDHMRKLMWDKPFNIIWASKPITERE